MKLVSKGALHFLLSLTITLSASLRMFVNPLWHYNLHFLGGGAFFSIYSSESDGKEYKMVVVD